MKLDDQKIKRDVVNHLVWDSRVDASNITIEVADGIVKLDGTVPSALARTAAVEDTAAVAGVTDVVDAMRIFIPASTVLPTDADLKVTITNMLAANPDIDPSRISVIVQGGRVSLEGSVDVHWKKRFVEELVAMHRGVTDVESSLTVVPTKNAADQATADDIIGALGRHAMIDADRMTVQVEDGCVTLTGSVPVAAARNVARSIASCTFGVVDVNDRLDVVPLEA